MVRITEELVRKKSEHNECEISTLEELSLHQEDIEKIEHLQNWCKNLQILLLQGNLISRIENLHKLKSLQYLNLAINNIEVIENLERCESLEKLDLTLNFIGDLQSVCTLQNNIHLKELYLTGNPCVDFTGYRSYVIAKLPQLQQLDNQDITHSERIQALQKVADIKNQIIFEEENYKMKRKKQRERLKNIDNSSIPDDIFWKQESEHCPEVRVEMSKRTRRARERETEKSKEENKTVKLFAKDGRPLNINQAKVKFKFISDNPAEFTLELEVYKYLDTTLIDVDVQPTYVTVSIKGKIFQFVLPEEVITSRSVAQRSQTTGHLAIRMPKLKVRENNKTLGPTRFQVQPEVSAMDRKKRREYLEIGSDRLTEICNLVDYQKPKETPEEFIDDPSVPQLE